MERRQPVLLTFGWKILSKKTRFTWNALASNLTYPPSLLREIARQHFGGAILPAEHLSVITLPQILS